MNKYQKETIDEVIRQLNNKRNDILYDIKLYREQIIQCDEKIKDIDKKISDLKK